MPFCFILVISAVGISVPSIFCFCIASQAGEGREARLVRAGSSVPKVAEGRKKNSQHCVVLCV